MNQIYDLLDAAYLDIEENRLTTPVENNAYFKYLKVLTLSPTNKDAISGLNRIVDTYLNWAIDSIQQGQYRRAQAFVYKARSVDEHHPNITAIELRIKNAKLNQQNVVELDPEALSAKGDIIKLALIKVAAKIETQSNVIAITARNDAEGRWIYQQLNAHTELRVRARFKLGTQPNIDLKPR